MARDKRKYEELFPEELEEVQREASIIYCAFGPVEYHGVMNTLGIDPVKAYEMCLRAAAISGGVVYPMVPVAPGGAPPLKREGLRQRALEGVPGFYPSIFTGIDICEALYCELFETFAEDLGFKVCVAFGGHGPAATLIRRIADENGNAIKGMKLLPAGSLTHNKDLILEHNRQLGLRRINHAGLWETAMNMACNPEFVDLSTLDRPCSDRFDEYPEEDSPGMTVPSKQELRQTTQAFGEQLLQTAAERVAAAARALLAEG